MLVKICGVTNEADALLAVALGADAIGFNFVASSPRRIAPRDARAIADKLPGGTMTVGVFQNEPPDVVVRTIYDANLTAAQLHGRELPAESREVAQHVKYLIKAFKAGDPALDHLDDYGAAALLIDGPTPGQGRVFDWQTFDGSRRELPLILAGGLTPDNVAQAIATVKPFGVDVASGVEPVDAGIGAGGTKDPMLLRKFMKAARAAEAEHGLAPPSVGDDALGLTSRSGSLPGTRERARPAGSAAGAPYDWRDE